MKFIKLFAKDNTGAFLLGMCLTFFAGVTNIVLIKLVGTGLEGDTLNLSELLTTIFFLLMVAFLFGVSAQWILEGVGHKFVYRLRTHLLAQVLQADPQHFQTIEKGRLLNAFSKDIPQLLMAVSFSPYMFYGIALIIGGVIYMFWLSWAMALIIVCILIISIVGSNKLISYCQALVFHERELHNSMIGSYNNIIDGHNELALNEHRAHIAFQNIANGDALDSKNTLLKAGRIIAISSQFMGILPLMLIGITLWINHQWLLGSTSIVVAFAITLLFIRQPLGNLVHQIEVMIHAKVALQNLTNLGLVDPYAFDPADALSKQWQTLRLESVVFQYPGNDKFHFGPLDFTIKRGELVFFVGKNGAGKSTLVKLLCGLNTPVEGNVYLGDELISIENRRQYRAMFSAVLSENYLFNCLVGGVTGDRQLQDELIDQFELTNVDFTKTGEFDVNNFSTGQKKRLAMQ